MSLEIKQSSKWWYARISEGGERRRSNLGIKIEGKRPVSMSERGDKAFERSRRAAKNEHDRVLMEFRRKRNDEDMIKQLIESKNGNVPEFVALKELPGLWESIPRKQNPSAKYIKSSMVVLQRFVDFITGKYPNVKDLISVRKEHVRAFMDAEETKGVSARTWNKYFGLLKTSFRHLQPEADAYRHYLSTAPQKKEETVHRKPFSNEDIEAILEAAEGDEFIRPLIVTALSTAMRRGDCATLKWADVDMNEEYISVKTAKTGGKVEIPILPMLKKELDQLDPSDGEYVFPKAAEMYKENPSGLNWRLKKVLASAGFVDAGNTEKPKKIVDEEIEPLPKLEPDELRKRGLQAVEDSNSSKVKKRNMKTIFLAYLKGNSIARVAEKNSFSKSTVSSHLNEIESMVGAAIVRRRKNQSQPGKVRGSIYADKVNGNRLRRGSVRGWHSFRTTFVTKALSAGMPMALVRRVTGHSTVDVVTKYYFHPDRKEFRQAMEKVMPDFL